MQHAAVSACSTVLAANPKAHTQRHINVRHSSEMMLEMIYSYVGFFPPLSGIEGRQQHSKLFPHLGRVLGDIC